MQRQARHHVQPLIALIAPIATRPLAIFLLAAVAAVIAVPLFAGTENTNHQQKISQSGVGRSEESPAKKEKAEPKTLPANGETLSRPARALRVWFDVAPEVENSSLSLTGPSGEVSVQGLHSMGDNDLMARVVGPMPDGQYTANWSTQDSNGNQMEGSWTFTIKRSPNGRS